MYPYKMSTSGHPAKACFVTMSGSHPFSNVKVAKKKLKEGAVRILLKWKEKKFF